MPVTFTVSGNLADFGNAVSSGVKMLAFPMPDVKVSDTSIHGAARAAEDTTDELGNFTLTLISLPGLWYSIRSADGTSVNPVRIAAYNPDPLDETTGTVFASGVNIDLRLVMDECPTPGYGLLAYSGPPNELTVGDVTTGPPGSDVEVVISGIPPSQVLDITIPRGDKGEDSTVPGPASTVPGPPNVLSIGTVTASAPGADAEADIDGTSPAQTLNLVIPRGLTGPQGETRYLVQDGATYPARPAPLGAPVTFVGSANPDLLGLMVNGDSWINTDADQVIPYVKHYDGAGSPEGVVAAQIGSRYIDVNATAGAVEWIKKSGIGNTGWQITDGSTGWRLLSYADIGSPSGFAPGTNISVLRTGTLVSITMPNTTTSATYTADDVPANRFELPAGFRLFNAFTYPVRNGSTGGGLYIANFAGGHLGYKWNAPAPNQTMSQTQFCFQTRDAWPTTLPGTAA